MPVEIVWSVLAQTRLPEIRSYVAEDKPEAAARLALRIVSVVEALSEHPFLGRTGAEPGIRELVIGGTPYTVLYRVRAGRVMISTIWHGAQRRRPTQNAGPQRSQATAESCSPVPNNALETGQPVYYPIIGLDPVTGSAIVAS